MKYVCLLMGAFLMMGCQDEKQPIPPGKERDSIAGDYVSLTEEQAKAVSIELISLRRQPMSGTLQLNGKVSVNPEYLVSLSSPLGGRVSAIYTLPGKPVTKGEVIMILEDHQFIQLQQDYLTIKARLLSAEPDYLRQKELNSSKAASDKALQQAETTYRMLLADKSGLEEKLRSLHILPESLTPERIRKHIEIVSPFDGLVSRILVNKGKYVLPSDVLGELINPEGLLLYLKVFEKDLGSIFPGQQVEAYTNPEPDRKIRAQIITTGNVIHEDGSTEVIAKVIQASSMGLIAGLYVHASVALDSQEVYVLPEEALVAFQGKSYVFVSAGSHTFQMAEVQTGWMHQGMAEILNYEDFQNKLLVREGAYALLMALKNPPEAP